MAKKVKYRRIISNKFYTPEELAKKVGLTVTTIYRCIKKGLLANMDSRPYLIYGGDAKDYFLSIEGKVSVVVADNEVYCQTCKKITYLPKTPLEIETTGKLYQDNKYQIRILGRCDHCGRRFSRLKSFISKRKLKKGATISIEEYTKGGKI